MARTVRDKKKRREFKAKAFVTPGSENPHAKKFEKTGKARHRPPVNETEAAFRKQFLAAGATKSGAADAAAALYKGHPDGRSHGGPSSMTPSAQMMIAKSQKQNRRKKNRG